MFPTVRDLFSARCPDLILYLDNPTSPFWESVANNTISNEELAAEIQRCHDEHLYGSIEQRAATELLAARLDQMV
jgi:hypothetical protein